MNDPVVVTKDSADHPLDLSSIQTEEVIHQAILSKQEKPVVSHVELETMGEPPRLVETKNMSEAELNQAYGQSNKLDFNRSGTLLELGNKSLTDLATVAKRLLADRTIGDSGEVGEIASSVLEGIKVLRLEDLQKEASGAVTTSKGLFGRIAGLVGDGRSAIKGFAQNRKRFIALMEQQEAKARARKGTLRVDVDLIEKMSDSARHGVSQLKLDIAAAQIAIERGYRQAEQLRERAIESGDPTDAAYYMDFRSNIKTLEGKAMELRTALLRAATLIPTISSTRRAAETRIMKIDNGLLLVIPNLMSAAAMAAVHADIKESEQASNALEEADRQVLKLVSEGTRAVATSAARSNATDQRNIDALALSAQTAIDTLNEVILIENQVTEQNKQSEAQLVQIRDQLVHGMQGVHQNALK